jgi:hypothetical protein
VAFIHGFDSRNSHRQLTSSLSFRCHPMGRMRGCYPRNAGSSPAAGADALVAQWTEFPLPKRVVAGSTPAEGASRPVAHRQSGAVTRRARQVRLLLGRPRPRHGGRHGVHGVTAAHRVVVPAVVGSNPPEHPSHGPGHPVRPSGCKPPASRCAGSNPAPCTYGPPWLDRRQRPASNRNTESRWRCRNVFRRGAQYSSWYRTSGLPAWTPPEARPFGSSHSSCRPRAVRSR